jgi:hypothetical protein
MGDPLSIVSPSSSRDDILDGDLSAETVAEFLESIHSAAPVVGHTHTFYRYPARFSPQFARAAIKLFTDPNDTVLDPFSGGGTTAVESLLSGRKFIGCDVNALARFVARVKTTPLRDSDIVAVEEWGRCLPASINCLKPNTRHEGWEKYQHNVPWWLRKLLETALDGADQLRKPRRINFARCSLLRTAQWALDCRKEIPGVREFLSLHGRFLQAMVSAAESFTVDMAAAGGKTSFCRLLARSAVGLEDDRRIPKDWLPPRLVLTSPPYLGVHVLYHRWQVQGRRETPAPYWLAGCQDGHGGSYYTFADRRNVKLEPYLDKLKGCFSSVAKLLDRKSVVLQLVAFSDPANQLEPYLATLEAAGLTEMQFSGAAQSLNRVWRKVPNRKWYANLKPGTHASNELLLIHRLKTN